ncbi:MBL fold metallo-hydrolase [Rhodopseudomonas parapalustris]
MKVQILGSSSSGNCYLLQGKNQTLIIECGVDLQFVLKKMKFDISNIAGCIISHEHNDHSKYINSLMRKGIDVYGSPGTFEALGIDKYENHRINYLFSETVQKIGEFVVIPFKTKHDAAEPLGFYIFHSEMGSMLFATDTYYIEYVFKDVDHIFIECNYAMDILESKQLPVSLKRRIIKSHFELNNVKKYLSGLDLSTTREIVLLHLSDGNSDSERFKRDIEGITGKPVYIADKDMELELE